MQINGEIFKKFEDNLLEDHILKKINELNIRGICSTDSSITPKLELLSLEADAEVQIIKIFTFMNFNL